MKQLLPTSSHPIAPTVRHFITYIGKVAGGHTTINDLLVHNALINFWRKNKQEMSSVSRISDWTGVPKATVSRIVTKGIEEGTILESIDPDDRRKRVLTIGPKGVERVEGFYGFLSKKHRRHEVKMKKQASRRT